MRYESEILYDLMKRDGLLNPPQNNLPYESELKEKYVNDVEGAYPKLQDYRSEWLNYALEDGIGEFPYVTLTDVTNATIDNVVPYAYKSAILKGKTDENLQSVKMPVLTTTGKNLYNKEIHQRPSIMGADSKLFYATDYIPVLPNTTYTKSNNTRLELCDSNKVSIGGASATTFTTTSDTHYIRYNVLKSEIDTHQLEKGSKQTSYEPYKSNILTVNEDVTLRGIGNVKDELNCLTGEVTERIGEIVLDGTQSNVGYRSEYSNDDYYCFMYDITKNGYKKAPSSPIGISCPIPFQQNKMFSWTTAKEFVLIDSNDLVVKLLKSKLNNDNSISSLNTYLASNPITINYLLKTESVKTVDLMVTNQNGESLSKISPIEGTMHLTTSSDTIPPLFSGEIPVEAIEQNLASFADLEGVEHDG